MKVQEYRKAMNLACTTKNLIMDFDERLNQLESEISEIFLIHNQSNRVLKLNRLRDELNGYFIRIFQTINSAVSLYKKQEMKIKSFQKIQSLFDEEIDQLNNLISSMKEPRNHSSHPNAYQVNLYLFSHSKEIKKGLNKVLKKLNKLLVIKEKDFSREIEKRNTWVEKKFSEVLPINVETEVVVCIV